jgi:isopentenyl-diphosphate delta-isomerase
LFQPEGNTDFKGVLKGISECKKRLSIPIIVKEVGSGISLSVAQRLYDIGIDGIDVAGKGGTSWSAVEMKRNSSEYSEYFKEWGISTSESLLSLQSFCKQKQIALFSSGGIRSSHDIAMSLAMGAHSVGMARPILLAYHTDGIDGVRTCIEGMMKDVRRIMFLTGSEHCEALSNAEYTERQRN